MKTTVKLWTVAHDALEAELLAGHNMRRFNNSHSMFFTEEGAREFRLSCENRDALQVFSVTLTIEVGEPAEKGGETK